MSNPTRLASVLLLLTLFSGFPGAKEGLGQQSYPSNFSKDISESGAVRDALTWLESNFESQVEEWVRITEISAKSGFEGERAAFLKEELEQEGVEVAIDAAGNLVAKLEGSGGGPTVVFGAHMENFRDIAEILTESGGGFQISDENKLFEHLRVWLTEPATCREQGEKAQAAIQPHQGAVARNLEVIRSLLETG